VPNAKVSIRNLETGQAADIQTDRTGTFNLPKLVPGDYEVTVSVQGFAVKADKVTLTAGATLTYNATLTALPAEPQPQSPASSGANASPGNAPSLQDLGFSPAEIKGSPKEQALLERRTHMLKIHQRLGLITTLPMIASVATSINAGGRDTSNTDRTVHMILGSATADLYFTTAYFAIRAPRVPGTRSRGPIRFHKAMAWIHGPGMILTPILGALAYSQKNNGERVHGIAKAHGPVAIVTAGAFGAALLSVSVKF
jgi:Carboxypeptidase regulatory-like domain